MTKSRSRSHIAAVVKAAKKSAARIAQLERKAKQAEDGIAAWAEYERSQRFRLELTAKLSAS